MFRICRNRAEIGPGLGMGVLPKEATDNLLVETKHQLLQRRGREDLKKRLKTGDGKNKQGKMIIDRSWVNVPVAALQTTTTAMVAQ